MKYDPFNDLQPPKNLIKDCIKAFNLQAKELLIDVQELRQNSLADWLVEKKLSTHKQLINKIRRYQMYLNDVDVSLNWEFAKQRAKERPITEFYIGKLRKSGSRLMGKCPFHADGTPSFVIYPNNKARCFGCGWFGDSIDFVSKLNNLEFKDAIKLMV